MAVSIDMGAVLGKGQKEVAPGGSKHKEFMEKFDGAMEGRTVLETGGMKHTPAEAGEKFIEVLQAQIDGSGLSDGARAAIGDISLDGVSEIGEGKYTVGISISSHSSPSLQPEEYGQIDNLAKLFNHGVDHVMRPVQGEYNGNVIWSRTVIPGAHFLQEAKAAFEGGYGGEYNVLEVAIVGDGW